MTNRGLSCLNTCWNNRLTAAGGGVVSAHGDVAVVLIIDTEGAEHAAGGAGVGVGGEGAGGPGGSVATEVRAVVPGGGGEGARHGVSSGSDHGGVGDGATGP